MRPCQRLAWRAGGASDDSSGGLRSEKVEAACTAAAGPLAEYRLHHARPEQGEAQGLPRVFEAAVAVGRDLWPSQTAALLPGRDVLDVGCGNTFYGAVMRALAARSYLGTEPRLNLGTQAFRSRLQGLGDLGR